MQLELLCLGAVPLTASSSLSGSTSTLRSQCEGESAALAEPDVVASTKPSASQLPAVSCVATADIGPIAPPRRKKKRSKPPEPPFTLPVISDSIPIPPKVSNLFTAYCTLCIFAQIILLLFYFLLLILIHNSLLSIVKNAWVCSVLVPKF